LRYRKQVKEHLRNTGLRGACYEQYVRTLLRRVLGSNSPYKVGYGEVLFKDQEHSSQLDVIVYDSRIALPQFECGEIVVIPAEAARIVIELKAVLAIGTSLSNALHSTEASFLKLKEESPAKVFYFCITSGRYTLEELEKLRSTSPRHGIDELFVMRGKGKQLNEGELKRFVDSVHRCTAK